MPIKVQQRNFSGPLDTLLMLIKKRKLSITDISLSQITNDYLQYISQLEQISYDEVSSFLHIASTLLLIKTKIFFPKSKLSDEDEQNITDLKMRLKLLDALKPLLRQTRKQLQTADSKFIIQGQKPTPEFTPPTNINKSIIHTTAKQIIHANKLQNPTIPRAKLKYSIKLDQIVDRVKQNLIQGASCDICNLALSHNTKNKKLSLILHFLATLELYKQHSNIEVSQSGNSIIVYYHPES